MIKNQEKRLRELSQLKLPALWARYAEVVGQPNRSPNKTFLVRAILAAMEREAAVQQHGASVARRKSGRREDVAFQVLPVRIESNLVQQLDEAWRRHGLRSRMDLFRHALSEYLQSIGETEVAERLIAGQAE